MAVTRTYDDFARMLGRRKSNADTSSADILQPGGIIGGAGIVDRMLVEPLTKLYEKAHEAWMRPQEGKRGFLGFNEDMYGDDMGRYTFSRYRPPDRLAWQAEEYRKMARDAEKEYESMHSREHLERAERYKKKAEELEKMAEERKAGNEARKEQYQERMGKKGNNLNDSYRPGGKISNKENMRYYKYFEKGGRVVSNPRRYQTGGTADSQDVQKQLIALVQAAYQGNEDAQTQIQQIMQAAQQGNQQAMQLAQMIQQIIQAMEGKAASQRAGGKINYIKRLRNGG